jgi:hypothetical protein
MRRSHGGLTGRAGSLPGAFLLLLAIPLGTWLACGTALPPVPAPPGGAVRYSFLIAGHQAGRATARPGAGGEWAFTFEFNDRGRGPNLAASYVLEERGTPVHVAITGQDYWKAAVDERFDVGAEKATWQDGLEKGERQVGGRAFYLLRQSLPQELGLLARALLAARGRLDLLPAGEARIEKVGATQVQGPGFARGVDLYAISGLGFDPQYVWLDQQASLFALYSSWSSTVLEGWESALPELAKVQDRVEAARQRGLAGKLAHRPAGRLAIRGARLFDPASGQSRPGMTVVIAGNRIEQVGSDAEVQIPPGSAEVVEARGRALLPGLWDMHVHLSEGDGLLNLAAGVTSVRDMANDIDFLIELRRRFDAGESVGPRVLMAGFIDGPGPYAGPSKVLAATEEEALAAVDRYAKLGYSQIKLYSSLDPKLVPPIVARAREHGLRVSGHIPNGMSAEQAVRAGFNEIQHANFLFLNFIPGVDTRTPERFTAVAQHAAELDLSSRAVRDFIGLLKERSVAVDPTLNIFERMFTDRPGEVSHVYAAVADRMPVQVRRGLLAGGLPVPAGMDERYRQSFQAMLVLVRALQEAGITIEAGTDSLNGFSLHRELELYAGAGIPVPEVLRIATLGAARVMARDKDLGSIAAGKLADLIMVDGDPAVRIGDIRRVVLTIKDGVLFDPAELYRSIGVKPVE